MVANDKASSAISCGNHCSRVYNLIIVSALMSERTRTEKSVSSKQSDFCTAAPSVRCFCRLDTMLNFPGKNPDFVGLNNHQITPKKKWIVNSLVSVIPKRVRRWLSYLAPIIQARRQKREKKAHENSLSAIYFGNMFIKIAVAMNFAAIHTSSMVNSTSANQQWHTLFVDFEACILPSGYLPRVHPTSSGGSGGNSQVWRLD